MKTHVKTSLIQNILRILLAVFMLYAGFSHLTFNRLDFQAQVPDWLPISKDLVVILSGIVEMLLGLGLALWKNQRARFGWALAFFLSSFFQATSHSIWTVKMPLGHLIQTKPPGSLVFPTSAHRLGFVVNGRLESMENA